MNIDRETIEKIANLARLELQESKKAGLVEEMNKILTFMEKLNELDTAGVEPLVYMNEMVNTWRADEVVQELTTEDALKNAPLRSDNYFIVPKILEK